MGKKDDDVSEDGFDPGDEGSDDEAELFIQQVEDNVAKDD